MEPPPTQPVSEPAAERAGAAGEGWAPPFSNAGTVVASVLLALIVAALVPLWVAVEPRELLDDPDGLLLLVADRHLDLASYLEAAPRWQRWLLDPAGRPGGVLEETIGWYREAVRDAPSPARQTTLAVLLAEAGRLPEAEASLPGGSYGQTLRSAVRRAYGGEGAPLELAIPELLERIELRWARDAVMARLAARRGEESRAADLRAAPALRGRRLAQRSLPPALASVALAVAGLLLLAGWAWRGRPRLALGETSGPSWSFAAGYAVLVRAALWGGACLVAGSLLLGEGLWALTAATILASWPLWVLGGRYLLRPQGLTVAAGPGLTVARQRWPALAGATLAVMGANIAGGWLLTEIAAALGSPVGWAEATVEELRAPGTLAFAGWIAGAVVAAPLCEEIAFRGFLYRTLRAALPVLPAALAGAALFGALHLYSLPGFLSVAWSGVVWSIATERTGSLLPGLVDHAWSNALATAISLALYGP